MGENRLVLIAIGVMVTTSQVFLIAGYNATAIKIAMPTTESLPLVAAELNAAAYQMEQEGLDGTDTEIAASTTHTKRVAKDDDVEYKEYQGVMGRPGIDFPVLPSIPHTSFSCRKVKNAGYYADLETDCQVFHICDGGRKISFLCPNGTVFRQSHLICDWWFKVDCSESEGLYETSAEQLAADQEVYRQRAQALQRTMQLAPTTPRTDSAYTRVIGNQERRFSPSSPPTASTPVFNRVTPQPSRPPSRNDQPTGPSGPGFPDAFQRGGRTFQGQTASGGDVFQYNYSGNRNFVQSSTPSGRGTTTYQVTGPGTRSTSSPAAPRGRGVQSQFRFGGQDPSYSGQASFNVVSSTVRAPPARRPTGPGREDFSAAESGRPSLQPYRHQDSGELNYPPGVNPYIKVTTTPQLQPKKKFQSTSFPQYTVSSSYRSSTTPQPVEKEHQVLAETASFASNRGNRFSFGTSAKGEDTQYESEPSFESRVVSDAPNNILTTTSTPNALQKSYFDFNRPRFVPDTERTTATSTNATPTPFYRKYQDILRSKETTATPTRPTFSTSTPYKGTTKYVELQRSRTVSYSAQTTIPSSQPTRETPHDPPTTRYITLGRIVPKAATMKSASSTPSTTTEPYTYTTYPTTLPPVEITTVFNNAPVNSLRSLELAAPSPHNEEPPQNHTTPAPQGTYLALYFATEETIAPNTEVPSTVPTAPEAPADKLSISDVLLLPHVNENFTDFAPKEGENQKVPSSLTQLTKDSYSSLFAGTESPLTTTTPAYETTILNELDEPDITANSNDLNVEQSRGIVEPEIPNTIAERPAKLPPNNLPSIGESTDLRELAQIFARALSTYLDDPESFRRVLAEVRPTEPPPAPEVTTEKSEPTVPSNSDESSVTKEKDEVLVFSDELKGPSAKKRPSNALYQTALPYIQPVVTTPEPTTTEAYTFPTGFATTAEISSSTLPTIDLEAPLQRLETLLDSQSRYYSSLEGQTTVPPNSSNYTSIAADVNSLIAILSSLNESWTDYPLTAAASTDDTYFPSGPSAPDNGLPRYGGFQNNSSYKPYGSDLSSTAETTTPVAVSSTVEYTTTTAPESASLSYEIQKENLEKIDSALGSFIPEDLNQLAILATENSSAVPPSGSDLKQAQEITDPSNSLSNRDQVLETAGSQAYTSKDRYLPQQSSTMPNSNDAVPVTKRPRYDGPIFVTPSRASPTVSTMATTTTPSTTTTSTTRRPSSTPSTRRRLSTQPSTTQSAGHRFRASKHLASQDLRARPTAGSVPVTVAQAKLLAKPTPQPRLLETSLDTTRRREEPQRATQTNARLSKSALPEVRVPTHQLSLIANGKRLPPEDKLNAHKVMNPLDINYELTTTSSTRQTPATLIELLTTLLPTLTPTIAYSTPPATKPTTLPPATTTSEATAPTTYHPITSRSSPTVETQPTSSPVPIPTPQPVNISVPSISMSVASSVSLSKATSDDLAVSGSSSNVPTTLSPQIMPANTSQEMMVEAKSMFGHLNSTMKATLMNMLKEAETNMTLRRLVLLLVNDHHRSMNVTTQEARRQLLEALLNPTETRSSVAPATSPSVVPPTPEIIKRETTTEKPAPSRRKPSRRANKSHLKGKTEGVYSSRRSASRGSTTSTTTTTTSTTTRRPTDIPTTNAVLATILPNSSEDMTLASSDSRAVELLRSLYSLAAQWG